MILRPKVELLTTDYQKRIFEEAKSILETQGVLIENKDAQELLRNESITEKNERFFIPSDLVEKLRKKVPSEIKLYNREGALTSTLAGDQVHFDPGSAAIFIQDIESGDIREAKSNDYIMFTKIIDHLDNLVAQSTSIAYSDVPQSAQDWHRLYVALTYSSKPIVTGTFRVESFAIMRELLETTRTSPKKLAEKPLAIFDACPSPPLMWSDLTTQSVIDAANAEIPSEFVSMPLAGSTAPISLIGCVTQHTTECLAGLVIAQLAKQGAPVIWGGSPAIFDMKHGTTPMGAIETMMINIADAQMGKYLGLPTHAYMGLSDSKVPDAQAGFEAGMGALLAALTGINMISGAGMLDFESTQSFENIIIGNEIAGMTLRLVRGLSDYGSPFAADILADYDPNLSLLGHTSTLDLFKKELLIPLRISNMQITDRGTRDQWKKEGALSSRQKANKIAKILADRPSRHPIDPSLKKELDSITKRELS